jgi:hypothetical protein
VQVQALLLTHSIIRTQENKEKPRYFMLAVDEDSLYAKAVTEFERDATTLATDLAAQLKKKRGKLPQKTLRELLSRFTALTERLKGLNIDPQEATPVELHPEGLERLAITWNTLVEECQGPGCKPRPSAPGQLTLGSLLSEPKPSELGFGFPARPPIFDRCVEPFETSVQLSCLSEKELEVLRLGTQDPPRLDEPMPTLPKIHEFAGSKVIRRYNALVKRYNAELVRRQHALAQLLPSNVGRLVRVAGVLRGQPVTLRGLVVPLPALAGKAFNKANGAVRTTSLREVAGGQPTFASAFYDKARYCITSQPPDAEVTVKGESVGRTPLCLENVPFSSLFEVTVKRSDYGQVGIGPRRMEPPADGLFEIHCTLAKTTAAPGHCKIL